MAVDKLELERKRLWLKRHILFKTVKFTPTRDEKGKNSSWPWEGKVIEIGIGYWDYSFVEITIDYWSFELKDGLLEWPDGPWGDAGCLKVSDYGNK